MQLPKTAFCLRVYISETDTLDRRPLYEAIVLQAKELKIAGATVFRSPMGFGASSHLHSAKILQLNPSLPLLVEIIDSRESLERLVPFLQEHITGGLVTLHPVEVLHHRAAPPVPQ